MKKTKKKKFLIETSAIRGILRLGCDAHRADILSRTADGEIYASTYIRKETIGAFICDIIEFAELIDQSSSVADACTWWSDKYGRKPKALGGVNATVLRQSITVSDSETHAAAVELAQIAYDLMDQFDLHFEKLAPNSVGCERGKLKPDADGSRLLDAMHEFRTAFLKDVQNCPINSFLQLGKKKGRAAKLVDCTALKSTKRMRGVIEPMEKLHAGGGTHVTCSNCRTIGDPVIALEQPKAMTLVHVDRSFDSLCKCTASPHERAPSNASFAPKISTPKSGGAGSGTVTP